ncbi:HD domain [Syntrophomonas zehnderi OL-4]|uniref:HD domain n=1 Tax=Syntrophomonas zehnderi OL-4 TaxID=690567 RepID=A0A0E4GC06_9FIRM|nr:hypothetical protein [Syntrophomonas zehnderi]CFY05224.1 HD domain [Syntrophomonas zehnderi OL-4]
MDIQFSDDFILRNSLIPISKLESSPVRPDDFFWQPIKASIEAADLSADDLYYNPLNATCPYCYYKNFIFLELQGIPHNPAELKEQINLIENGLNAAVAQRDFKLFITLINPKLAPNAFMEVFDFIADTDKYPLYEYLLKTNELASKVFPAEFKKKAGKYKGAKAGVPLADEKGYVAVFVSQAAGQLTPHKVNTWHTDINTAVKNALKNKPVGDIYQGRVQSEYIHSFVDDRLNNQALVDPYQVKHIEKLDLIKINEFIPQMHSAGITRQYELYARQIKPDWFHNPRGIHALSHSKRVLLLVLMLAYLEQCSQMDTRLLCQAAIYHDIGRKTDGYDTKHGLASYRKMLDKKLLNPIEEARAENLRFIIENHAVADISAIKQLDKYELESTDDTIRLFHIFKDADGLDRVRINDLNPKYLRTTHAPKLMLAAHQLYQAEDFESFLTEAGIK